MFEVPEPVLYLAMASVVDSDSSRWVLVIRKDQYKSHCRIRLQIFAYAQKVLRY